MTHAHIPIPPAHMHRVDETCPRWGGPLVEPPADETYTPLPEIETDLQSRKVCMKCRIGYQATNEGWLAVCSF
jgi:hypothetical protein